MRQIATNTRSRLTTPFTQRAPSMTPAAAAAAAEEEEEEKEAVELLWQRMLGATWTRQNKPMRVNSPAQRQTIWRR